MHSVLESLSKKPLASSCRCGASEEPRRRAYCVAKARPRELRESARMASTVHASPALRETAADEAPPSEPHSTDENRKEISTTGDVPSGSLQGGARPSASSGEPSSSSERGYAHRDETEFPQPAETTVSRKNDDNRIMLPQGAADSIAENGPRAFSTRDAADCTQQQPLDSGRADEEGCVSLEEKSPKTYSSPVASPDGPSERGARVCASDYHGGGSQSPNGSPKSVNRNSASSLNHGADKQPSLPRAGGTVASQHSSDGEVAYAHWLQRKQEEARRRKIRKQEEAEKQAAEREAILKKRRVRARNLRRRLDAEKETRKQMERKLLQRMLRDRRTKRKPSEKSPAQSRGRRRGRARGLQATATAHHDASPGRMAQSQTAARTAAFEHAPHRARDAPAGKGEREHLSNSMAVLPSSKQLGPARAWGGKEEETGPTPPRQKLRQGRYPLRNATSQHTSLPELPARKRPNFVQRIQNSPLNRTLRDRGQSSRSPERRRSSERRPVQKHQAPETSPLQGVKAALHFEEKESGARGTSSVLPEETERPQQANPAPIDVPSEREEAKEARQDHADEKGAIEKKASGKEVKGKETDDTGGDRTSVPSQAHSRHSSRKEVRSPVLHPKPRTPVLQRRDRSRHSSRPGLQRLGPAETPDKGLSPESKRHLFDPTVPVSRQFNRYSPAWGFVDASHPPMPHHRPKLPRRVSPIRAGNDNKPGQSSSTDEKPHKMVEWPADAPSERETQGGADPGVSGSPTAVQSSASHESSAPDSDAEAPPHEVQDEEITGPADGSRPAPAIPRDQVPGPPRPPPPPPPRNHRLSVTAPESGSVPEDEGERGIAEKDAPAAATDQDVAATRDRSGSVHSQDASRGEIASAMAVAKEAEGAFGESPAESAEGGVGRKEEEEMQGRDGKERGSEKEKEDESGEQPTPVGEEDGAQEQPEPEKEGEGEQQESVEASQASRSGVVSSTTEAGRRASGVDEKDSGAVVPSGDGNEGAADGASGETGDDKGGAKEASVVDLGAQEEQIRGEVHHKLLAAYLIRHSRDPPQSRQATQEQYDKANTQARQLLDAHGLKVWDQIEHRRPGTTNQFTHIANQEIARRIEALRADHAVSAADGNGSAPAVQGPGGHDELSFHKSGSPGRPSSVNGNASPAAGAASVQSPTRSSPVASDPLEESERMRVLLFFHRIAPEDANLGMKLYHQYRGRMWVALRRKYPQQVAAFEEEFPEDTNPMILRAELRHLGLSLPEMGPGSGSIERKAPGGHEKNEKAVQRLVAARRALTEIPSAEWRELGEHRGSDWLSIAVLGLVCVLLGEEPKMPRALELMREAATPARILRLQPSALTQEALTVSKRLAIRAKLFEQLPHIENAAMRVLAVWEIVLLQAAGVQLPSPAR